MSSINIKTLHDGLNLKDDLADLSLPEGVTSECVGFDLTVGGKLQVAKGNTTDHDLTDYLPIGNTQCSQVIYMDSIRYVLATTEDGLYSNAILVDADFTGRFKALTFGSNIYLINGSLARRFDGTTCYQWGITPPVAMPTLSVGANTTKDIDTMEDTTDWITNASGCVVSDEGTIVKAGSHSCHIAMAAVGEGSTYRDIALDLSTLGSANSSDDDLIRFWVYIDDLTKLNYLRLLFDVSDGNFNQDFYSYEWNFYGADSQLIRSVIGGSAEVITENEPVAPSKFVSIKNDNIEDVLKIRSFNGQNIELYQTTDLSKVTSGVWVKLHVPKSSFIRTGISTADWSNVVTVGLEVGSNDAVNVYVDQIQLIGGGKLLGIYYFMYGWARVDVGGNVLHYSGPARAADGTLDIHGPATFERQPLEWSTRIPSTDPQVNACVIYVIGGNLTEWYVLDVILDNLTTTGQTVNGEEDCYRKMISLRNDPAPAGLDMVLHRNSIWMVGFTDLPNVIRKSDISPDGDILIEGWPARNAYIPTGSGSLLTSIDVLNRQVVVRSLDGEWVLDISNPSDYSSVSQDEVVGKGCLSRDGVMRFGSSVIYPAAGAFVESNGSTRSLVMPETSPVITSSGVANAVAVFNNFEGYFSFIDNQGLDRTAKLDLYRGSPRIAYQNNKSYTWLFVDSNTGIVYGILDGAVVRLNYGYDDRGNQLECQLTSRIFTVGKDAVWKRMSFFHLTNNQWLHIDGYVDDIHVGHQTFKSSVRKECRFDFGPVSGERFQFTIWGQYSDLVEIYLPLRLYVDGTATGQ